jgi:hypothetical protein
MSLTRNTPIRPLSRQGNTLIRNASWLLEAAGLSSDVLAIIRVVESAPRTVAEGDNPDIGRSLCAFLLAAAEAMPMTQRQYGRFISVASFWLDEVASWHPHKRHCLERMVRLALKPGR